MKTLRYTIALFLLVINVIPTTNNTGGLYAQDIHFSQFTMTPLQLDPSQAGKFGGDERAILNYRNQWNSVASPYKTYGFSFDMGFNRRHQRNSFFGAGVSVYSDKAGDANMGLTLVNLALGYHIRINRDSYLSTGVQGGFLQNGIDDARLRFGSQYDGTGHNDKLSSGEAFHNNSFFQPDFSAGVSYSYGTISNNVVSNNGYENTKVNIGFAVHHVTSPNYSYFKNNAENLSFKYTFHTNSSFGVQGTNMAIQPSGFIAFQQEATDIVLGTFFRYNLKEKSRFTKFSNGAALSLGAHYRVADAFIPSILIETGVLAFGVSYDANLSGLTAASKGNGGFEFSLRYVSPNPFGRRKSSARFF